MTAALREDLDPIQIGADLPGMWWPELDALSHRVIVRMEFVSEAASTGRAGGRVNAGRPVSSAPRGDESLSDAHRERITAAAQSDLDAYYAAVDRGDEPPEPQKYRSAILQAALALRRATHGAALTPDDQVIAGMGVERIDWILHTYVDVDPEYAAAIETQRAGWVSAEVVRRLRRRNGHHRKTGRPVPLGDEIQESVLALHRTDPSRSLRSIADELDIGKDTVARVLRETT